MKVTKAKTLSTLLYRFGGFLPRLVASEQTRTTAHLFRGTPPLGSLRIVSMTFVPLGALAPMRSEVWMGMFAKQTTVLLLGPVGGVEERRGLGPRASARFVN
jgi:hypothetical protein